MQAVKVYKCPHCGEKYKSLKVWGNHVESKHPGLIPEGWSPARYFYFIQTGKREGHCVECKNPTEWNEGTQKYERFCRNPKCKEIYRQRFVNRMISTRGKVHLLDDPEQQRKMLAAKKISGVYTFKNGMKVNYTGTYELDFLKMLDTFLEFDPNDLMMPSPHTYYYDYHNPEDPEHEGRHFYIPDAYIPSLNLEIEIKQNTNKHPKIIRIDKVKEAQKDAMMRTVPGIHYLKIVEKDYTGFFEFIENYNPDVKSTVAQALEALAAIVPTKDIPTSDTIPTSGIKFTEYDAMYSPPKEKAKLSSFEAIPLDLGIIKAFRSEVPNLKHVRHNRSCQGELFMDSKKPVGYYQTSKDGNCIWIQAFEICEEYRGKGISEQMLSRAIRKTNATNLTVDLKNELAIRLYMKNGFTEYARTPKVMLMRRDPV